MSGYGKTKRSGWARKVGRIGWLNKKSYKNFVQKLLIQTYLKQASKLFRRSSAEPGLGGAPPCIIGKVVM